MKSSPQVKRIVCLRFPDWPVQRLLASRPELARTVLLLTETTRRGEFVSCCNLRASRRGVSVGMPLAEARSLVSGRDVVHVEPIQPEADRAALEKLALHCEQYSPCVGLEEAESPQCLLLDITGIVHLFGGEHSLIRRLQRGLTAKSFKVQIAIGDSVGAAWAAARYLARSDEPVVVPQGEHDALSELPIEGLRLGEVVVPKLHRLGIRTIRQILNLKRSSLPARFGNEINRQIDQFMGKQPELIILCRPQPKFQVEHILDAGTTQPETLECLLSMLLERLASLLHEQQRGTRHLQCTLTTEQKTKHAITVRLCKATADARHLGDLLRFRLERLRLDAPLIGIRMEALEISRLEQPQQELFVGPSQDVAHQLSSLLNRLSSRLGHQAVVRPCLLPDAIPERAFQYLSVTEKGFSTATEINRQFLPLDRPTCLLPQPMAVDVIVVVPNGPPAVLFVNRLRLGIVQSWGAERIESGWWQGFYVRRDYYQVETAEGRRFWLFQRLSDGQWFLHGAVL